MYCTNHNISHFDYKRENGEIYAGATEETSVFDVDTSEPSSTSLPKSFIMQTRNCGAKTKGTPMKREDFKT